MCIFCSCMEYLEFQVYIGNDEKCIVKRKHYCRKAPTKENALQQEHTTHNNKSTIKTKKFEVVGPIQNNETKSKLTKHLTDNSKV